MWNSFRKKPLLTEEDALFQIECFKWLLTHFGGDDFYKNTQLVLPTSDCFPSIVDSKESAAQTTLKQVMKYAGMENWPVTLQAQEEDPNHLVAPTLAVQNVEQSPLGTFYLTRTAPEPPPGGWENWEFATDIGATFLGFGIFQANAAFNFRQYASVDAVGWQTLGGGYLTEAEHSYSLAIFLRLKELAPEIAFPHCDANVKGYLRRALVELDRGSVIPELKEVAYVPRIS